MPDRGDGTLYLLYTPPRGKLSCESTRDTAGSIDLIAVSNSSMACSTVSVFVAVKGGAYSLVVDDVDTQLGCAAPLHFLIVYIPSEFFTSPYSKFIPRVYGVLAAVSIPSGDGGRARAGKYPVQPVAIRHANAALAALCIITFVGLLYSDDCCRVLWDRANTDIDLE